MTIHPLLAKRPRAAALFGAACVAAMLLLIAPSPPPPRPRFGKAVPAQHHLVRYPNQSHVLWRAGADGYSRNSQAVRT